MSVKLDLGANICVVNSQEYRCWESAGTGYIIKEMGWPLHVPLCLFYLVFSERYYRNHNWNEWFFIAVNYRQRLCFLPFRSLWGKMYIMFILYQSKIIFIHVPRYKNTSLHLSYFFRYFYIGSDCSKTNSIQREKPLLQPSATFFPAELLLLKHVLPKFSGNLASSWATMKGEWVADCRFSLSLFSSCLLICWTCTEPVQDDPKPWLVLDEYR